MGGSKLLNRGSVGLKYSLPELALYNLKPSAAVIQASLLRTGFDNINPGTRLWKNCQRDQGNTIAP